MTNDDIHKVALAHGFTERLQSDGSTDLNAYVYAFARAMFEAGRSAVPAETASVLRVLIDAATERVKHFYDGECPHSCDHDQRDYNCPVCSAIVQAEKLLADHVGEDAEMVAVPAGWKLVPAEPTANMLYAGSKWACSLALETYKDMIAAAPKVKP